jgi:hypothetical protein
MAGQVRLAVCEGVALGEIKSDRLRGGRPRRKITIPLVESLRPRGDNLGYRCTGLRRSPAATRLGLRA